MKKLICKLIGHTWNMDSTSTKKWTDDDQAECEQTTIYISCTVCSKQETRGGGISKMFTLQNDNG